MASIVTSNGPTEPKTKRVQIVTNDSPTTDSLETPNPTRLLGIGTSHAEFPSTAELMQKCLSVNPFEAKFREANMRLTSGAFEANGLLPSSMNMTSSNGMSHTLLKLPSSLSQSPGIFSNISILTTDVDGVNENLKTADISKLLQQMKDQGTSNNDASQAPRTADVLNAVLDMHSDRLHTINYLNKPDFSFLSSLTPSGSAPNSASILAAATVAHSLPSTSGGLLAPLPRASPAHSPRQQTTQSQRDIILDFSKQRSPTGSEVSVGSQPNLLTVLHSSTTQDPTAWDPRDIKPPTSKMSRMPDYFDHEESVGGQPTVASIPGGHNIMSLDDRSNRSIYSSERELTPTNGTGRGRGRGRAALTDMPADERNVRMTILERNKAAAVRYRKRKKEEHDDMITRVHTLEQDKVQLSTQNQVLRRELDRVTALLREREVRCVCLKGTLPLSTDMRSDSPSDLMQVDILSSPNHSGMYIPQTQQLINGLGLSNGMSSMKRKL